MKTRPVRKLRSAKMRGSMKGSLAVARWTPKTQKPVIVRKA